jgi:hypothetical protein
MKTEKLLIIGDSYSTFEGYIPEGYAVYYDKAETRPGTGVSSVEHTWWSIFSRETGMEIIENNSWSGSTVCYTGRGGDCSHDSSFIYRLRCLCESNFRGKGAPDTLIIFGATNDSWIDAPLGEAKLEGFEESDLYSVLPAIADIICEARTALPKTRIVYVINTGLKPEIGAQVKAASEHYGAEYVELSDIDKVSGHPTALGMRQIADQLKAHF